MDYQITIEEMKKRVQNFCEDREWDQFHNPKDLAIGISTEANELLDLFRFKTTEQMEKMFHDVDELTLIGEELADTLFFILRFAQMNNIDLDKILDDKMRKNSKRYTVEKSKGKNEKIDKL